MSTKIHHTVDKMDLTQHLKVENIANNLCFYETSRGIKRGG